MCTQFRLAQDTTSHLLERKLLFNWRERGALFIRVITSANANYKHPITASYITKWGLRTACVRMIVWNSGLFGFVVNFPRPVDSRNTEGTIACCCAFVMCIHWILEEESFKTWRYYLYGVAQCWFRLPNNATCESANYGHLLQPYWDFFLGFC